MPSAPFPRRTVLAALALLVLGSLLPAACAEPTPPTPAPAAAPIRIVCTTAMIGDIVRRVAGDRAKVEVLMGPGTDPHLYKPTRTDIAKLSSADVVFYNGLLLEGKLTETFDRLASSGKRVHAVTQRLTESDLLTKDQPGPAEGGGGAAHKPAGDAVPTDPHAWMNPRLWSEAVQTVRLKLAELDPAHADGYASRADTLKAELAELDAYAEKVLSSVPETSRVLVTAHDAFNYFAKRYSFRVEGVQGISTESEAGVRDIQRLVDLIVDRKVAAVFVESSVSDRNVKALIAGAKARGHSVAIGGELFSDAMGPEGTYEGTYIGMIDHNVTTIARALGGQAPQRGMLGKLGKK